MNAPEAVLALVAATTMVLAVAFMTVGKLTVAGALFMSTSVIIYTATPSSSACSEA